MTEIAELAMKKNGAARICIPMERESFPRCKGKRFNSRMMSGVTIFHEYAQHNSMASGVFQWIVSLDDA
jgi:hypothetical protein